MSTSASATTPSLPWQVQRKPSLKVTILIYTVGLLLLAGGGVFGAMIHLEHKPWFGLGIGAIMAALLVAGVLKGTLVTIDQSAVLTLNYGAKDNLRFHLSLIEDSTMVMAGNLSGVGLRLSDYTAIEFIHKSGHTYRSMEKLRAELGVDLVLEHLTAQDRQVILSLRDGASTPHKQVEKA